MTVKKNSLREIITSNIDDKTRLGSADTMSPQVLAYIGDTVYDLYVRTFLLARNDIHTSSLHNKATKLVCASAQSIAYREIAELLTENEMTVFRRGRNYNGTHSPKNASVSDYRAATGLEALIGYLFLSEQDERINELMNKILSRGEESKKVE